MIAASLTCCRSDSGGLVSKPPEEGQADVLLHPLPVLQHAQNVLLRRQGKTVYSLKGVFISLGVFRR